MDSEALLRSAALPDDMRTSLQAAVREATAAGVTPLAATLVRAHEPDEAKRMQLYASLLSSLQQEAPCPTAAASKASEPCAEPAGPSGAGKSKDASKTPAEEEHPKPGAKVKWCRKCKGAAREACKVRGHITTSLFNAMRKLELDWSAEQELYRLMNRELGYAARLYAYVAPVRDEDYELEFSGGSLELTLASTILTYREALYMADVLEYARLTSSGQKGKYVKVALKMNIPRTLLFKFPSRSKDETLPNGAVLCQSGWGMGPASRLRMFLKPLPPHEATEFDILIGYHQCTTPKEDALQVQWHKKNDCDNKQCFQCHGKGSPPTAELEDADLMSKDENGYYDSDDSSYKFYPSEDMMSDESSGDE